MRKVKWIFFAYLALVALVIIGIGVSFAVVPQRDPHTLYTAYGSNIRTLDPGNIGDTTGAAVAGNIFECLYNYDYNAKGYVLIPEIAAGMPEVSQGGLTWTIRLKHGIHYSDPDRKVFPQGQGPEVQAADFIYAWKRIANFYQASQNWSAIFEDKVVGLDEFRDYTKTCKPNDVNYDRPVEGLQAPDPYTLVIKLKRPYPQLRFNLAHLPTAPISRDAAGYWGDELKHHPIGTGPYMLSAKENLPEQRITFFANPFYRGGPQVDGDHPLPEGQRLPHIKRIQLDYFDEDLPAWALFQQGLLDIAGIPKDVFGQAINTQTGGLTPEMQARGIRLQKTPEPSVFFYGFNMLDPVVGKNRPLREAMSLAFDRQQYIDLFLNGRGIPAIGPIPPGFPTYDPKLASPYARYDVDAAKAKVAEAIKVQGGPIPPITLLLPGTDTTFRQMGEFMQKEMAAIGLDLRVDYTSWARFQEMVDSKQAQFYALGWQADYPDEQTFLQLFWSRNASPGPNSANYSNPEFDKIYEQAIVMEPGPQRDALYRKMQEIVNQDTPWLVTFCPVAYTLSYDWVKNLHENIYAHGNRKYVELDETLRSRKLGSH